MAPLVLFLMYLTAPVSWPIAKLLDVILGEHKLTRFNNTQLQAIVQMHCKAALLEHEGHINTPEVGDSAKPGLDQAQARIISGALRSKHRNAGDIMKRMNKVYSLSTSTVVDKDLLLEMRNKAYSRIPIYYNENKHLVFGILMLKSLVGFETSKLEEELTIGDIIS